jgi:[ribosomal protein S5]-alanine N-acetyltransferase
MPPPAPTNIKKENKMTLENNTEFTSERLIFKPTWTANSIEMSTAGNDIEIASAVGERFPFPYRKIDADEFKKYSEESWQKGTEYNLAIYDKDTKKYIGNIGFKISEDRTIVTNIGYWLGKDFHGKGFATEALVEVLKFIEEKFTDVKEIKATAADYNVASKNVLKKCGFIETGEVDPPRVRQNGKVDVSIKFVKIMI